MKKSLIIFSFLLIAFSCKEEIEKNFPQASLKNYDVLGSSLEVKDGTLHFGSNFFEVTEILTKMTEEELDQWEKQVGFKSFRSFIKEIYERTSEMDNFNEMWLVENYPNVFRNVNESVFPIIESPIDRIICNQFGEYYTAGVYNRVLRDRLISVVNPCKEKIEKALLIEKSNGYEGIYSFPHRSVESDLKNTCIDFYHVIRRNSDREVNMQMKVEVKTSVVQNFPFDYKVQRYYVFWQVWGRKKNFWGNWVQYDTDLYVEDAKFSLYAPFKSTYQPDPNNDSYTMNWFDSTPVTVSYSNIWSCSRHYYPGHEIKTMALGPELPEPRFQRVNGYAWTRGIWDKAHLACGAW
jgi:hypothetical protein